MPSHALYWWHHTHYIWHVIYCVWYHIHCIDNITPTISVASLSPYMWHHLHYTGHHSLTFDLKPPFWGHHNHYIRHLFHCICVITPTLSMLHNQYMYDITSRICETFCPLYLWHRTHYVWPHKPVCWLHHFRHMYDIICATEDVSSTLSHQATIFMNSHPLQAWHHIPCIRHRTNCIFVITASPLVSHQLLYDITLSVSVISYALYITSYPLIMSSHYCT